MIDLDALLRYLGRNEVSRLDRTTLGHLRQWVASGLERLASDSAATAGIDAEMDRELEQRTAVLSKASGEIERAIA